MDKPGDLILWWKIRNEQVQWVKVKTPEEALAKARGLITTFPKPDFTQACPSSYEIGLQEYQGPKSIEEFFEFGDGWEAWRDEEGRSIEDLLWSDDEKETA